MGISRAISIALVFCLSKGETQKNTGSILLSNGVNASEVVSSRQAGYGLVRFEGPVDHDGDPGRPTKANPFPGDSPNNSPLKFEDDNTSYTTQNNFNLSAEVHNIVSFKDDTDYNTNMHINQISSQKKRARGRRRRKSRRHNIMFGPGGQPTMLGQSFQQEPVSKPNRREMSVPLPAMSNAYDSIIQSDSKNCVRLLLCQEVAKNNNNSLIQMALQGFQYYVPELKDTPQIKVLPLANSVVSTLMSVAMRYGAKAPNALACQQRYPACPNNPDERVSYIRKLYLSSFQLHGQYTETEFNNQMQQLGLKSQPNNANGLYQPKYGPNGQQLASLYPLYNGNNGFQKPYSYPKQNILRQQNFKTNSQNSYGVYQNKIGNQFNKPYAGHISSSQQILGILAAFG